MHNLLKQHSGGNGSWLQISTFLTDAILSGSLQASWSGVGVDLQESKFKFNTSKFLKVKCISLRRRKIIHRGKSWVIWKEGGIKQNMLLALFCESRRWVSIKR